MYKLMNVLNCVAFEAAPVFYKLLFMSITAVCIGAVLLLLRRFLDKKIPPVWKYILWGLPLFALLVPYRPHSDLALMQSVSAIEDISYREEYDTVRYELHNAPQSEASNAETQAAVDSLKKQESYTYLQSAFFDVALPLIWLGGMIGGFAFLAVSKVWLSRKIRKHTLFTGQHEELLQECKETLKIKTAVSVVVQDYVSAPALMGILRPRIVLPVFAGELSRDTLSCILMHELAHLKRRDLFVNELLLVLRTVYWFNPLVRLLFRYLLEDMEVRNDDYLLNRMGSEHSKSYARSLVEVLRLSQTVSPVPKLLCMADGGKNIERRIGMIRLEKSFKQHTLIVSAACLLLFCVVGVLFLTNGSRPRETMKWANDLSIGDIVRIELVVTPGENGESYRLLQESEFAHIVSLVNQSKGSYVEDPEPIEGSVAMFYLTTKSGEIHTVANIGNTYLMIGNDTYDAGYTWLSGWEYPPANQAVPGDFHYGGKLSAFKGLEVYVWKDDKDNARFTLLPGTDRMKTEDEIYVLSAASADIDEIGKILSLYEDGTYLFLMQMDREDFTAEDMTSFKDTLLEYLPSANVSVGMFSS